MTHIYIPKSSDNYVVYTSLRINKSQHAFGFLGTFIPNLFTELLFEGSCFFSLG